MPGALRAPKDSVDPIDQDWVRACLAEMKSKCEWPACGVQATYAWEGVSSIAYLCETHATEVLINRSVGRMVEGHLWQTFNQMYNFIMQNEESGGALLAGIRARTEQIHTNKIEANRQTLRNKRIVTNALRDYLDAPGQVGLPDDELASARGVQSPSPAPIQFIFWETEPEPPDPVTLPLPDKPQPLLSVRLL
jgi:hypothetical protein